MAVSSYLEKKLVLSYSLYWFDQIGRNGKSMAIPRLKILKVKQEMKLECFSYTKVGVEVITHISPH